MAQSPRPKAKPYHEQVAEALIQQLEAGTAPFQRPWKPGEQLLPYNAHSGRRYRGANVLNLAMQGRSDPRWITYNQAKSMGAQVRRGEKSTMVRYWQFDEDVPKLDARGNPVIGADGKPVKTKVPLEKPRAFSAYVFNGEQIENMPPLPERNNVQEEWERHERADRIITASGANIKHVQGDRAFYRPSSDEIVLPERGQFETADRYYATLLHELGHWTGHESRLNRDLKNPFGSEEYAKEELRAEIASLMAGNDLGLGHDPGQHAAYVKSWVKVLRDDPMEIMRAAADAEKIMNMVLSFERTQTQTQDEINTQAQADKQQPQPVPTLTVTDLTKTEHERMSEAERRYKQELQRVYGDSFQDNWDAVKHSQENIDPMLQEAAQEFKVAGEAWLEALEKASDRVGFVNMGAKGLADSLQPDEVVAEMQKAAEGPIPERIYLSVPWKEKNAAKSLGAWWDNTKKLWYVPPGMDSAPFARWNGEPQTIETPESIETETRDEKARQHSSSPSPQSFEADEQDEQEHHYSDLTLAELVAEYGWEYVSEDKSRGVVRQFDGVGFVGGMIAPNGERNLYASYSADPERRRYIAVTLGDTRIVDFDGREASPADIARKVNESAAQFADQKRLKNGLEPIYAGAGLAGRVQETAPTQADKPSRIYIAVPWKEKELAKAVGAKWDEPANSWYVAAGSELSKVQRWLPGNSTTSSKPKIRVEDEFLEALRSLGMEPGLDRRTKHPVMDGSRQRVPVSGDKGSERSGFYVAYMNEGGRPAGFIQNNKTGESIKWVSCGTELDPQQLAEQRAIIAQKQAEREADTRRTHDEKSVKLTKQFNAYQSLTSVTPYLEQKGITVGKITSGLKTSKDGTATIIPAYDITGKQWTTQYIQPDGKKLFAKDARKEGCFYPIGGNTSDLARATSIIICEGFATGATLQKAAPSSTVLVAFDSKNLARVALIVAEKYPDVPKILAADDDAHAVMTCGKNVGVSSASEVAGEAKAVVLEPIFSASEKVWPEDVPRFTPEQWRAGSLTDAQQEAFRQYKKLTDFNDMELKSSLGLDGVRRQVEAALVTAQSQIHKLSRLETQDTARTRAANRNENEQQEQSKQRKIGKARTR